MLQSSSLEDSQDSYRKNNKIVVFEQFPSDNLTPIQAFLALGSSAESILLESAEQDEKLGRFSLIALRPLAVFSSKEGYSKFSHSDQESKFSCDPFQALRQALQEMQLENSTDLPPFVGDALGFVAYDCIRRIESIPNRHQDNLQIPDLCFFFPSLYLVFDHHTSTLTIALIKEGCRNLEKDKEAAINEIASIYRQITQSDTSTFLPEKPFSCEVEEEIDDPLFCDKIERAKQYIRQGEAFQIALSRSFSCEYRGNPFTIYRALRMTNPSPFMFYFQTAKFAIAGSSPERLLKLEGKTLQTVPIAGTRPRIIGKEEEIAAELLQDPKENAEHMMLVDLGRNDLGVVAKVGTVRVKQCKKPHFFSHVVHLTSVVEAQIEDSFDAMDAFKAIFPAGTLTGAPKIRAMQIIDELEESRRGLYGGAICRITASGDFDSCIAIRTAVIQEQRATVRAGCGVVLDSIPQKEAEETRNKAKGVIQAIQMAAGGNI